MIFKLLLISKFTYKELLKSKILYATLGIGLALIVITYVATEFTYGVPEKVALDFGLGMLSISSLGIALFMGSTLLSKEIDSRTVYMIISRPVPRSIFISGKTLGLTSVLISNIFFLSVIMACCSYMLGGKINPLLIWAILFNILEATLLMLIVVLFSLFCNPVLSTIFGIVLLISGHAIQETLSITFVKTNVVFENFLSLYHMLFPAFYKLNLKDFVIYQQDLSAQFLTNSLLYGVSYSLFIFLLIVFFFNRKNLD